MNHKNFSIHVTYVKINQLRTILFITVNSFYCLLHSSSSTNLFLFITFINHYFSWSCSFKFERSIRLCSFSYFHWSDWREKRLASGRGNSHHSSPLPVLSSPFPICFIDFDAFLTQNRAKEKAKPPNKKITAHRSSKSNLQSSTVDVGSSTANTIPLP